jgi:uncharacterized OsmC-like protein
MATQMKTVATNTVINGVDVTALGDTLAAVVQQPALADFQFRTANRWLGGSRNRSAIKGFFGAGREDTTRTATFVYDSDEPLVLMGEDKAPNPVEYLLHALAGCMTTTMVYHAAMRGIEIAALESEIVGDIDIRGFAGLSSSVPKGYREIRVTFRARTAAEPAVLESLARMSPVFNSVAGSVPVLLRVETR